MNWLGYLILFRQNDLMHVLRRSVELASKSCRSLCFGV